MICEKKTFKHLFIISKNYCNQNQYNIVNEHCSLDLDVAHHVYLDILNLLKAHHCTGALII